MPSTIVFTFILSKQQLQKKLIQWQRDESKSPNRFSSIFTGTFFIAWESAQEFHRLQFNYACEHLVHKRRRRKIGRCIK